MRRAVDATHDPARATWVESARRPGGDFPVQNLPFGVFLRAEGPPRIGVAIGDEVLDLLRCHEEGLLSGLEVPLTEACGEADLGPLMALGRSAWAALRRRVSALLSDADPRSAPQDLRGRILVAQRHVELLLPASVRDYTDFYASIHHATNVGRLLRPDNPLLPNYKHVPIAYHGRASSLVVSGTPVKRPHGQRKPHDAETPLFGPTQALDYELEAGFFVGPGNTRGVPIPIDEAEDHLFGLCLVNDWSARDIQAWEYQPLGPFLAKSFATSVSPWVVTLEALAPFRCPAATRAEGDPQPLPYLSSATNAAEGGLLVRLEVFVQSQRMREAGIGPARLCRSSLTHLYWTPAQMLTHHASNGCLLRAGDLLASGTVSGPDDDSLGCLLELTRRGARPLCLPTGEERSFLADGDEVILRGYCERDGHARIGLGECRGVVVG